MSAAVSSPEKVPSPAKVLRALFWKLLFRGRAAQQMGSQKTKRQLGLAATLGLYALVGILPATMTQGADSFIFASVLHACTFMFASLTLAANAGTMLFVKEEAEILLHRPVTPQQMLRAKCSVLAGFALLLALALNLIGLFVGLSKAGATWRFIPAHLLSTALLMLFSAACIILMYNVCLKWFGRERLDNLLATIQTLLTMVMILGGQILPRVLTADTVRDLNTSTSGWVLALPPAWFGAIDALIGGTTLNPSTLWLPAAIGVAATVLTSWLALEKLGDAYGQGLMNLNESASTVKDSGRPRGRWLRALVRMPPLRWWLRDPVERQAFILTTAYLVRDREVKLRLYPGIAPMLIMPLFMLFSTTSSRPGSNDMGIMVQGFASCFLGMVPLQAMLFLGCSEHWRASAFFHSAPLPHWTPLFHGARKAVLACLTFPVLVVQAVLVCSLQHSLVPLLLSLPALVFLPAFSLVTGVIASWLPLAKPSEEVKNNLNGCLVMAATMIAAGLVGGVASWMWRIGWFWPYLAGLTLTMRAAAWVMEKLMRGKPWPVLGE